MKHPIQLGNLLSRTEDDHQRIVSFAFLCLGIIESLAKGTIDASDAVKIFFHAENCRFVRMVLRQESADEIMGYGVQLTDLSDVLSPEEARREFERELELMQARCLDLLATERMAA
uniref:Uncharacterized protein n=1 Tax=Candidatus Kentrum sp. FW TaxID=2126338 RepID=A0A450TRJ2_9GAMM|nr:MAG: hypothetical protein BECKFW1821C_GA0114237_102511 [Candidatus Kentron sp. FW]